MEPTLLELSASVMAPALDVRLMDPPYRPFAYMLPPPVELTLMNDTAFSTTVPAVPADDETSTAVWLELPVNPASKMEDVELVTFIVPPCVKPIADRLPSDTALTPVTLMLPPEEPKLSVVRGLSRF